MGIILAILCVSLLAAVGILLMVASCALKQMQTPKGACWILCVLFFYFIMPLCMVFIKKVSKVLRSFLREGELQAWAQQNKSMVLKIRLIFDFVLFGTTGIVLSAFALPLVLARANVIKWEAVGIISVAHFFIFGSMFAFYKQSVRHKHEAEEKHQYNLNSCKNTRAVMTSLIKHQ